MTHSTGSGDLWEGLRERLADALREIERLEARIERAHRRMERLATHYENHHSDDYGAWLREERDAA